jgi:hypothetical protein
LDERVGRLVAALAFATGCSRDLGSPAAPSAGSVLPSLAAAGGAPGSPFGTNALELIELPGSTPAGGWGRVSVIPTGVPGFNNFEMTVVAHGAPPGADLCFTSSGEVTPG